MKKLTLLLLLCGTVFCAVAQTDVPQTNFVTRTDPDVWKTTLNRHEFSVSWGDALWCQWVVNESFWAWDYFRPSPMEEYSPASWFGDDTYSKNTWTLGAQSFSYMFRVKKWFWVGGEITYAGFYTNVYDKFTDKVVGHNNSHLISIMPKIRFSYFNRKHVMLYSGLSLGFGIEINPDFVWGHFAGQLTTFGVKAGANWFGFAEIGWGYKGFGLVGFGYHFNKQRNQSLSAQQNGLINKY